MTETFPADFLWGAATSAFQIEGAAAADGKGPSIWDAFTHTPGKTAHGDSGDVACDHYHRFREDIDLMRELGLGAYRFSISWPRVLPQGRGPVNASGLDFYDRLVDGLQAAGIEPFVTLYHWDLPAALQTELGGWLHPDLPNIFADYAGVIFERLADRVRFWVTINEPWCVVEAGYFTGVHAPGIKDRDQGYVAGHNLLRAHAYATARYRASGNPAGAISLAVNSSYCYPASDAREDVEAAERAMLIFGGWFADPAHFGDYPAVMRERLGSQLPEFSAEDRALLTGSMDYLALNYYTSDVVKFAPGVVPMEIETVAQADRAHTDTGWPIVPEGLHRLLHWLSLRYPGRAIYITENGVALPDEPDAEGFVNDQGRIRYLRDHLAAVRAARADKIDLRGYLVWSLLDNLEWSAGFSKRFGLIRCDFDTLKRTIKASGRWYADVIRNGRG